MLPLLLILAAGAVACGDAGTPPDAGGNYVATLAAPAGNLDGAAVLELTGAGIEDVTAAGVQLFMERSGDRMRVVIVRDDPGVIRFDIRVARGSRLPQAQVIEVADGSDALRASVSGYTVRFTR